MDNLLKPIADNSIFDSLFMDYKREAFRLELYPEYRVESEKGELERYLKGEPFEWNNGYREWCANLAEAAKRGARMWRIRRLSDPLTDYERMEIDWAYKTQAPYGLQVWALYREFKQMPELNDLPYAFDYWMFDEKTVILVEYDLLGKWIACHEYLGDPAPYIALRDKLKKLSRRLV